jgi:hypothetical protein
MTGLRLSQKPKLNVKKEAIAKHFANHFPYFILQKKPFKPNLHQYLQVYTHADCY